MFDFLKQMPNPINFGGGTGGVAPDAAKKAPPPPKPAEGLPPSADPQPGALSEVFAGLVDQGQDAEMSSLVAKKPEPLKAHTLDPMQYDPDPTKRTYRQQDEKQNWGKGADETDEAFRARLLKASTDFADGVKLNRFDSQELYQVESEKRDYERSKWNSQVGAFERGQLSEAQLAAMKIGLTDGGMPLSHNTPIKDIESPAGRMETLNILTQNMDPEGHDKTKVDVVTCAGASIVGGVLLAGGKEGLDKLLTACHKPGTEETPEEKALREKLKSGSLTVGDLQELQLAVYKKLKENEEMDPKKMEETIKAASDPDPKKRAEAIKSLMVGPKGIEKLMKDNPAIQQMFAAHHLDLVSVDTDNDTEGPGGQATGNHMVLRIEDEKGEPVAYYDPWKKSADQGQIINAHDADIRRNSHEVPPAVVEDYNKATKSRGHYDQKMEDRDSIEKLSQQRYGRDPETHTWWSDEKEDEMRKLEHWGKRFGNNK